MRGLISTACPLDVLPDLSAFRDLLVSFVKAEWRATHEKRVRLPKGFEKSIAFDLAGIGDGSAVPKLEWDREIAQFLLPDFKDELESLVENAYAKIIEWWTVRTTTSRRLGCHPRVFVR